MTDLIESLGLCVSAMLWGMRSPAPARDLGEESARFSVVVGTGGRWA